MRTLQYFFLFLLCGLFLLRCAYAACQVTDDSGQILYFKKPAQRIISLSPGLTETLFAIGANKQTIGVIKGSDYPQAALALPLVGSYSNLDQEKILSLHPDLVVTWSNNFSLAFLKQAGIAVYVSNPHSLAGIVTTMRHLGCLSGQDASHAIQKFNRVIAQATPKQKVKRMEVFFELSSNPLLTLNQDSWVNDMIEKCGGRNVFAKLPWTVPHLSFESLLNANPEVVISAGLAPNWLAAWRRWPSIKAMKNKQFYTIPENLVYRPGPRLAQGVQKLCKLVEQAARNTN